MVSLSREEDLGRTAVERVKHSTESKSIQTPFFTSVEANDHDHLQQSPQVSFRQRSCIRSERSGHCSVGMQPNSSRVGSFISGCEGMHCSPIDHLSQRSQQTEVMRESELDRPCHCCLCIDERIRAAQMALGECHFCPPSYPVFRTPALLDPSQIPMAAPRSSQQLQPSNPALTLNSVLQLAALLQDVIRSRSPNPVLLSEVPGIMSHVYGQTIDPLTNPNFHISWTDLVLRYCPMIVLQPMLGTNEMLLYCNNSLKRLLAS